MKIQNYTEFWDFYIKEHSKPLTRWLHFTGTLVATLLFLWLIWKGLWYYFPLCFLIGYGLAWISHFFVEKNKPATFKYPFWSFISDYKMLILMLTGRMNREVERVLGRQQL